VSIRNDNFVWIGGWWVVAGWCFGAISFSLVEFPCSAHRLATVGACRRATVGKRAGKM
jgi:hypothetical protein